MDTNKILADLRVQRERINQAIAAVEALGGTAVSQKTARTATKNNRKAAALAPGAKPTAKRRAISPEGRKRMAEAQQKRWAKKKKAAKAAVATA